TLTACGTRQSPSTTPDATPVVEADAAPATLPTGDRTQRRPAADTPASPSSTPAIIGLLNAHDTADLPDRTTLDAHDDAVGALVWIANHGDPLAVRARATRLLGQYDDESAVQTQRDAVASLDAHPILVASAIRGLTDRGLTSDDESYALILKREAETDARIVAAVALAKESISIE
ncbi:MAG: hypothetical protein ACJA00_005472, partial [Myxococcota bacterium]